MDCPFGYFYRFHVTSTRKAQLQGEKTDSEKHGKANGNMWVKRLLHLAQYTRLSDIRHVDEDVVRWVTV